MCKLSRNPLQDFAWPFRALVDPGSLPNRKAWTLYRSPTLIIEALSNPLNRTRLGATTLARSLTLNRGYVPMSYAYMYFSMCIYICIYIYVCVSRNALYIYTHMYTYNCTIYICIYIYYYLCIIYLNIWLSKWFLQSCALRGSRYLAFEAGCLSPVSRQLHPEDELNNTHNEPYLSIVLPIYLILYYMMFHCTVLYYS